MSQKWAFFKKVFPNETVKCGLCDSTFKDAATIDVQILTCEGVTINVNWIEHEGQSKNIYNTKQDRKNKEEVSYTYTWSEDLFPELNT